MSGPLSNWLGRRRRRRAEWRAAAEQQEREHAALVARLSAEADYDSYEAFYSDDEARRGDDVSAGEVVDGELRWAIRWLPSTDVVAFPSGWSDERAHQVYVSVPVTLGSVGNNAGGVGRAIATALRPPLVVLLGHADSADEAQMRIAGAASLDAIRTALS